MRKDRLSAFKLRLQGKSYNEIAKTLGVPKSTLSSWFMGLALPEDARNRLKKRVYEKSVIALIQRNKLRTHRAIQNASSIREKARREIEPLNSTTLKFIGIILYWAEGYKKPIVKNGKTKTHHPVTLTNSDPFLVKVFLRFLLLLELSHFQYLLFFPTAQV